MVLKHEEKFKYIYSILLTKAKKNVHNRKMSIKYCSTKWMLRLNNAGSVNKLITKMY